MTEQAPRSDLRHSLTTEAKGLGRRLGPFILLRELGRGGMGVVYEARHETMREPVALKTIHASASEEAHLRFQIEGRILKQLRHPNIVPVVATGSVDGVAYVATSLCSGGSLSDRLAKEGSLPQEEALQITALLADALDHAHGWNLIHRDVKPQNILFDERADPLLADFGVVKQLDATGAELAKLSQTGQLIGTLAYMAPEQLSEEYGAPGIKADLFALGVVLYEMLSGAHPFRSQTDLETIGAIAFAEPPSLLALLPELDVDVATIVERCLAKSPEHRFASAAALGEDCRRALLREPIEAEPLGFGPRLAVWLVRNRRALQALVLVTFIALILGLVGALAFIGQKRRGRLTASRVLRVVQQRGTEARSSARQARRAAATAAAVRVEVIAAQEKIKAALSRTANSRVETQKNFEELRRLALNVVLKLNRSASTVSGTLGARRLLVLEAKRCLDTLAREAKGNLSLERELAKTYAELAGIQWVSGGVGLRDAEAGLASCDSALALLAGQGPGESLEIRAQLAYQRADCQRLRAEIFGARAILKDCLEAAQAGVKALRDCHGTKIVGAPRYLLALLLNLEGLGHHALHRIEAANKSFKAALALVPTPPGSDHWRYVTASVKVNQAALAQSSESGRDSERLANESLATMRVLLRTEPSPEQRASYSQKCIVLLASLVNRKRFKEALSIAEEVTQRLRALVRLDPENQEMFVNLALAFKFHARAHELAGQPKKALRRYLAAIEFLERYSRESDARSVDLVVEISDCHRGAARLTQTAADAQRHFGASSALLEELLAQSETNSRKLLLSDSLLEEIEYIGTVSEVEPQSRRVLALCRELAEASPRDGKVRDKLARALFWRGDQMKAQGKWVKALAFVDECLGIVRGLVRDAPSKHLAGIFKKQIQQILVKRKLIAGRVKSAKTPSLRAKRGRAQNRWDTQQFVPQRFSMTRLLPAFLVLLLIAAPVSAQSEDELFSSYEKVLLPLLHKRGDEQLAAEDVWQRLVVSSTHRAPHIAALLRLWKKYPTVAAREQIMSALSADDGEALRELRDGQLAKPDSVKLLGLSIEALGSYGEPKEVIRIEPFLRHKSDFVRASAAYGMSEIARRIDGQQDLTTLRFGLRAPRILKAFLPRVHALLEEKDENLRSFGVLLSIQLSRAEAPPLELLRKYSQDPAVAVRTVVARAAFSNLYFPFDAELIHLIADKDVKVALLATRALERRTRGSLPKPKRSKTLELIQADLREKDSAVLQSPRLLKVLGDIAMTTNDTPQALNLYRLAGDASARGGIEPDVYGHHAGATARCLAAQLLLDKGDKAGARAQLLSAWNDFPGESPVQFSFREEARALVVALRFMAKQAGLASFPKKPTRKFRRYKYKFHSSGKHGGGKVHGGLLKGYEPERLGPPLKPSEEEEDPHKGHDHSKKKD